MGCTAVGSCVLRNDPTAPLWRVVERHSRCSTYIPFVAGFAEATSVIRERKADPAFRAFVSQQKLATASAGAPVMGDLEFLLFQPIHRIPRYALLLRELLKLTPAQLSTHAQLMAVHKELEAICVEINSMSGEIDKRGKVSD